MKACVQYKDLAGTDVADISDRLRAAHGYKFENE